jgi:hypothetical protein
VSGPIAKIDPATPKIPDALWQQSGTPMTGWLVRGWIAALLIVAGGVLASVTGSVYFWALVAVGVAAFFVIPRLVESLLLTRLAAKVDAVERSHDADRGHAVLEEMRGNTTVKLLAPHGWLRVQEGRVHLAVGDGRAAAKAFAEAERVSTHASDKHELISAQAHALVLAGDRKEARELLVKLRKGDALSDLDHLNYGVVLLSEAGHNQEALGQLQQAREAFGDHPRTLAGLVLALQRCDKQDEAAALLGEAEAAVEASADLIAQDLLKRAKKGLRPLLKAKQKQKRKVDKPVEPSAATDADKQRKPKGKKGRKQARRDARKQAKAVARRGDAVGDEQTDTVGETEAAGDVAVRTAEASERDAGDEQVRDEASADESSDRDDAAEAAGEADERGDADEHDGDDRGDDDADADEHDDADADADGHDDEADTDDRDDADADEHDAADEHDDADERSDADERGDDEADANADERSDANHVVKADERDDDERADAEISDTVEAPPEQAPAKAERPREPVNTLAEAFAELRAIRQDPSASASSSSGSRPKPKDDDDDDGFDLATLAREALGSGTRRKLDPSEGGPSASGLRPIEPSSSGSMFRSALFDDPEPEQSEPTPSTRSSSSSSSSSSSLFDLPKFDSVPTFAPPPKSTRGPVLPSRAPSKPEPTKPAAPSVAPPKLGSIPSAPSIPAAPSIPVKKPAATAPALDDGWGDLGDPFAAPPAAPTADETDKD